MDKLYKCDPEKNTECTKESCGTHCTKTTNKKFAMQEEPTCTVRMDGEEVTTDDFIAIVVNDEADAVLIFNTDALTLGMALRLLTKSFAEMMAECTEEERNEIKAVLNNEHFIKQTDEESSARHVSQRPTLSLVTNGKKEVNNE